MDTGYVNKVWPHDQISVSGWIPWAVFGSGIGYLAWGNVGSLLWLWLLPFAFGRASSRSAAYALMLGYYLAGARGLPAGAAVFFGEAAPWWYGAVLWIGASALLALPFGLLWSDDVKRRGLRFLVALAIVAVPPLGLIGWCSPLAAAGALFPGLGWIGLVATAGLMAWISMARLSVDQAVVMVLIGGMVGLICNIEALIASPAAPTHWRGMDTEFPRLSSGGHDDAGQLLASMQRIRWIKDLAATVPAGETRVLPETVLGPLGGLAEFQLQQAEQALEARGSRLVVGAEVPQPDGRYINALVVLGSTTVKRPIIAQGIPVPVAMWNPFGRNGAVADLWGRSAVVDLGGTRVGGLICYEQLLPWPIFQRVVARPSVLLAVSNVWWARGTVIPAIQRQTVHAFARLFSLPVIAATNT